MNKLNIFNKILLGSCVLASPLLADNTPPTPVGTLNVNLAMVRQGTAPALAWKIKYPTQVTDVIDIPPTEEIIPKKKLRLKVSMVGVGITDRYGREYPAKNNLKFGSSAWATHFTGRGRDVNPEQLLVDRIVQPGESIRFSAKLNMSGYNYYYNQDRNVTILKNGDTPPNVAAGYDHQTSVASYLRPYVVDGKIALGPMDVLYVSELTHSDPSHYGYDMQDSIVLMQFENVE